MLPGRATSEVPNLRRKGRCRNPMMTTAQFQDIERAVAHHREHGYAEHNSGGRDCFCGGCRVVRIFEELLVAWARLS